MSAVKVSLLFCFFALICLTQSARILISFTLPGRSHYILGSSLARALAEKGHDVTMISAFGEKEPPKNGTYRDIVLTGFLEYMQNTMMKDNNMFDRQNANPFLMVTFMLSMMPQMSEKVFQHENFQKLLKSKEKFDVVIVEQFMNNAEKALATHFNAPLIIFNAMGPNFWINPFVGNPSPPSYIPDIMLDYTSDMTFFQRTFNSIVYVWNCLLYNLFLYPKENEIIQKYMPNGPNINDVLYNASIVLLNSHPSYNQPVPEVPSMIDIGGFHVKPPKKLPKDLQEFLDNAKDGVIYFSMGSNLKSSQMSVEKRDALLKTFSKLKEKVLWKWEEDVLPGQPPNVKLSKWFPQQDILAHPNVKLFITHGGMLSTTETIYHGVPVLAIPIYGDQNLNAKRAEKGGYGLVVEYKEISEELLTKTIRELLENPKYRNNVKEKSKLFHDRQVSPLDTAIYWVEYVARHKGAPHLRVAALNLPWYKYHLLDVISVLVLFALISLVISFKLMKCTCKLLFCRKKEKKVKKN